MAAAEILRIKSRSDLTYSVLMWDGAPLCFLLEEAWRNNQRRVSCIPEGDYICRRHKSAKFGECWEICGVPGRSAILIHAGNTTADTEGCPLTGNWAWGTVIRASRDAFNRLMRQTAGRSEFPLKVTVLKPSAGHMVAPK